jgi:hypothetical protein
MDTTPLADDAVRCGNTAVGARRAGRILEAVTGLCHFAVMWCEAHGVLDWFTIGPLDQFVK